MSRDVEIVAGARTPMTEYESSRTGDGRPGGAFAARTATQLGADAVREALARARQAPGGVDHIIMGNAIQSGPGGVYGARHTGLGAGLPETTPALTVNRLCGSGIQSIINGSQLIQLEEAQTVVAGGMENMSQCPHVVRGARSGFRLGQGAMVDSLAEALLDNYCGLQMAETAEKLATTYGISRDDQDAYAMRSQTEAARARDAGLHAEEIVPVDVGRRGRTRLIEHDDHLRPGTTMEALAKLPAVFSKDGCVTAGNASGIVDGAAAVVLRAANGAGGEPALGTIRGWSTTGVDPTIMGIGPVTAIRQLLDRHQLHIEDIDLFEINEAFAGQYLAVEKELDLDRGRVNVNGGAIALGHPLGATGTRLVLTLLHQMRRQGARLGVASACIGGGQGIAMLVERT